MSSNWAKLQAKQQAIAAIEMRLGGGGGGGPGGGGGGGGGGGSGGGGGGKGGSGGKGGGKGGKGSGGGHGGKGKGRGGGHGGKGKGRGGGGGGGQGGSSLGGDRSLSASGPQPGPHKKPRLSAPAPRFEAGGSGALQPLLEPGHAEYEACLRRCYRGFVHAPAPLPSALQQRVQAALVRVRVRGRVG